MILRPFSEPGAFDDAIEELSPALPLTLAESYAAALRTAYDGLLRARREQDEEAAKLAHRCQALEAQLAAALANAARANAQAGCSAEALMHNTAFTIKRLETDLARAERRQSDAMADGRLGWATAGALTFELSRLGTMTTELREQVAEATECFDYAYNRLQECRAELATARGEPPPKLWSDAAAQTTDPKAPGYIVD